jgi:hypothetical protein
VLFCQIIFGHVSCRISQTKYHNRHYCQGVPSQAVEDAEFEIKANFQGCTVALPTGLGFALTVFEPPKSLDCRMALLHFFEARIQGEFPGAIEGFSHEVLRAIELPVDSASRRRFTRTRAGTNLENGT